MSLQQSHHPDGATTVMTADWWQHPRLTGGSVLDTNAIPISKPTWLPYLSNNVPKQQNLCACCTWQSQTRREEGDIAGSMSGASRALDKDREEANGITSSLTWESL
uniref:Uncharacterized protein n=1 Tax=Eutreptiella gymnastica TaxID=73025 RepID=A0A7S1HXN3_9EUGL|mmetsp:Transcript_112736/g.195739  ORF Transcript_112736/g.195739 Transcript_112736/m.195739 type:complete len:106 (+) Transcript_112736:291-608(+)